VRYDKYGLCEKIGAVFPDIGECGIDVTVEYDEEKGGWLVNLQKERHHLKTYLEPHDAALCMEGKQCITLGMQVGQLRSNIERA
jgi:hypothetical protein